MTMHDAGGTQPPRTDTLDLTQPVAAWMPTLWYPSYTEGMPTLCVGLAPTPPFSRPHKAWLVETPGERAALVAALAKPIPVREGNVLDFRHGPDATCSRRSRFRPRDMVVAHYAPTDERWPHLVVAAAPEAVVQAVGAASLVRERYIVMPFETEAEAHEFLVHLGAIAGRAGAGLRFGHPAH
ncbi:hypothetical protein NS226_04085 [Aureimonas ureilytica]|uniref:Uncharacterized protein n=1 Tax=Aureimonas ureilytica TaxID=401562 RepID=A0A175REP5_9HYPH|nr:hypothetical protein [Aureimonas ureilytica]KTQ97821.1 hypothetical protein NS226_04085 [Aureimonas ureilytica]